jgi:hypothetical protein
MTCSSSCPTRDHETFGECLRSKNIQANVAVPGTGYDPARNKRWDSRIDSYKEARSHGVQPAGTKRSQIDAAVKASDATGEAFVAQ